MFRKPELLILSSGIWTHNLKSRKTEMEHWAKKFSKTSPQSLLKTRLDTFGNDFGHFWNFEIFRFFWKFSKTRPSREHGAKKIFRKICPKTCSKHVCTLLGTILGIYGTLNVFVFSENFPSLDPPWNSGRKLSFQKKAPKHVWTFGNDFGHF